MQVKGLKASLSTSQLPQGLGWVVGALCLPRPVMWLEGSRRAPLHGHSAHFVLRCSDLDKGYLRVDAGGIWEVKVNVVQASSQRG